MLFLGNQQKYYSIDELKQKGFSYYKIKQMEESGRLNRINRNTFEDLCYKGDENDFVDVTAYIHFGVICMMSAARYYGLTNFLPEVVDIAVDRKKKISNRPIWPGIKVYYFYSERMRLGVNEVFEDGNSFRIFDMEKTVVDIICYRNKVGIEETSEILRNYLKKQNRKIDRLYAYSKVLRCESVLRTYLEVLMV